MTHTKQELLLLCNEIKNNLKIIKNSLLKFHDISIDIVCDECDHEFEVNVYLDRNRRNYCYGWNGFNLNLDAVEYSGNRALGKIEEVERMIEGLREDIPGQILTEEGVV